MCVVGGGEILRVLCGLVFERFGCGFRRRCGRFGAGWIVVDTCMPFYMDDGAVAFTCRTMMLVVMSC